jgi:hypothetical protein
MCAVNSKSAVNFQRLSRMCVCRTARREGDVLDELSGLQQDPSLCVLDTGVQKVDLCGHRLEARSEFSGWITTGILARSDGTGYCFVPA